MREILTFRHIAVTLQILASAGALAIVGAALSTRGVPRVDRAIETAQLERTSLVEAQTPPGPTESAMAKDTGKRRIARPSELPQSAAIRLSNETVDVARQPNEIGDRGTDEIWNLSLAEAIHLALINNPILRVRSASCTAGSAIGTNVEGIRSVYDAAKDASVLAGRGVEAALSQNYSELPMVWGSNSAIQNTQPLWTGGSSGITRIAGPLRTQPAGVFGVSRGIAISRINTGIAIADFELAVGNLLRDVEEIYCDLYLAYRTYDANMEARNSFLRLWWLGAKRNGRDELQLREAYFKTRDAAQDSGTKLYDFETQLRRLCGLPIADGRLIRPIDDPSLAEFKPDWDLCLAEALNRRKAKVQPALADEDAEIWFSLREARANAERLEQELKITHELAQAFVTLDSRYHTMQSNYNLWQAVEAQTLECGSRYRTGVPNLESRVPLQQWLKARTDAATAEVAFYASLIEYQKALIELELRKGSLLEYNGVHLAELSWTAETYTDAFRCAWARALP